jgi:acetyl esterase/lipase
LSAALTNLFDDSYLSAEYAATSLDLSDPYLSPAAATDDMLRAAYPPLIILHTCEHDMLNAEGGVAFGERLKSPNVGKTVKGGIIENVPHAFDKMPNPKIYREVAERIYAEVCAELNAIVLGRSANHVKCSRRPPNK